MPVSWSLHPLNGSNVISNPPTTTADDSTGCFKIVHNPRKCRTRQLAGIKPFLECRALGKFVPEHLECELTHRRCCWVMDLGSVFNRKGSFRLRHLNFL